MLDALRHHKASSPDRDDAPGRGAHGQTVPAPLAQAFGRQDRDENVSPARRLGLALALVAVTALLVWQVAAMNGLLPAGPFSKLFGAIRTERAHLVPASQSPSRAPQPPGNLPASSTAPPALGRLLQPPSAGSGAGAQEAAKAARPAAAAEPTSAAVPEPRSVNARPPAADEATAPRAASRVPVPPVQIPRPAGARPAGAAAIARSGAGTAGSQPDSYAGPAPVRAPAGETDHFKLALYYQRVGDFENALVHYRAVIAADELNAEAHNNLGVLYQGKGLYDEAIKEFQRATFIDPRYDKAHNNLGVAFMRSGRTDAAIGEFRGLVANDARNVEALTNLALALRAAGRAEEARETLQRALTINGRYAQAHYNLALIYEERSEWQRAIEHFEQFLANAGSESAGLTVDVRARVHSLRAKLQ
jgi:tetratricopeptide (TPR) repeat protein